MIEISKTVTNKIVRLLLKSIPLIPASELFDIFEDLKKSKQTINEKIEKAHESLKDTSTLIEDLQSDLIERTEKISELRNQYEHYSKFAEIEEEKIKPLLLELDKTVNKGKNFERIVSFGINIIAGLIIFALGIWLGPKITKIFTSDNEKPVLEITK
jgi:predicted nuclease with TOPRIM domain